MSKNIISDELLKKALARAVAMENVIYAKQFEVEREHTFSGKYVEQMKDILAELEQESENTDAKFEAYYVSKRSVRMKILLIAVIVMLLGTITVVADPVRNKISQFIETVFDNHSDVGFTQSEDMEADLSEYPKELKGIPKGYELTAEENSLENLGLHYFLRIYVNDAGRELIFKQALIEEMDENSWSITSDGTPAKEIEVAGISAHMLKDERGYSSIVFQKDGFAYLVGGTADIEVLMNCIEATFRGDKADTE